MVNELNADTKWRLIGLFLLTLVVIAACGFMLYPFVPAITGAVVLATVTSRPYRWWRQKIRHSAAAAASAVVVVAVSIVGPALLLIQYLARHALDAAQMLSDGRAQHVLDTFLNQLPSAVRALDYSSELMTISGVVERLAGYFSSHLMGMLGNSLSAMVQVVAMLFLLFFLYRDEDGAVTYFSRLMPLSEGEFHKLQARLEETIRATVLGRLAVAAVQGVGAGIVFVSLGVPGAAIMGLLTAVAGMVPPLGAYAVWLPVAGWLAFTGHWAKMAILVTVGTLVISTLDNFLYPALVGAQLRQHTASVFLSLLGGVWLFGIAGLVLGPLMFSAAEELMAIWKARTAEVATTSDGR